VLPLSQVVVATDLPLRCCRWDAVGTEGNDLPTMEVAARGWTVCQQRKVWLVDVTVLYSAGGTPASFERNRDADERWR
jgi:hypothetical protein